jgi:hypothetical protein
MSLFHHLRQQMLDDGVEVDFSKDLALAAILSLDIRIDQGAGADPVFVTGEELNKLSLQCLGEREDDGPAAAAD